MDYSDIYFIIFLLVVIGWIWGLPKDQIYNSIVTILAAFITAGYFFERKRRHRG
jgi:hypothetical protein